jgi:hypothetical protein
VKKAHDHRVDTLAFGFSIGEALFIPKCRPLTQDQQLGAAFGLRAGTSVTCIGGDTLSKIVGALNGTVEVVLSPKQQPSWIHTVRLAVQDGVLHALEIATVDGDPDPQLKNLRKKYGAPTKKLKSGVEWDLPGLYVRYEYRKPPPGRDGDTVTIGVMGAVADGMAQAARESAARTIPNLFIQTETYRQANAAAEKKREDAEPRL